MWRVPGARPGMTDKWFFMIRRGTNITRLIFSFVSLEGKKPVESEYYWQSDFLPVLATRIASFDCKGGVKLEQASTRVAELLDQADQALSAAETGLEKEADLAEILAQAQKSATLLFTAFIQAKGEEAPAGASLRALWNRCVELEAEFADLEETVEYLIVESPVEDLDIEDLGEIVDAANEIWDFVVGFFPESDLP
jgi:HEPN domain-containing protein